MAAENSLRDGAYDLVRYVDPWGRHVTNMADLMPLMPTWVDVRSFNWCDDLVKKLKDPGDVGPQVWHVDTWAAGQAAGLSVHIPMVFSMFGVIFVVQTDVAVRPDDDGGMAVQVVPLVLDVTGGRVANADALDVMFEVHGMEYLAVLQQRALRKYPPVSLALLAEAELDAETLVLVDGRRLRGARFGASVLRIRPMRDLDLIDLTLLLGDDEGRLFQSELPHRVTSLRQAYKALCPLSTDEARTSHRQGEFWFVPISHEELGPHGRPEGTYLRSSGVKAKPLTKAQLRERELRPRALRGPEHGQATSYGGRLAVLIPDCEHFAAEVVRDDEGWVWARGLVRHRFHDHAPLELDGWHMVLHNGQLRAWSTGRTPT